MCGDSTDAGSVALLMNGKKADMVFTDPPYGVSYTEKNEFLNRRGTGHRLTTPIQNDEMPPEQMHDFWVPAFKNLHEFTNERMCYYITAPQGGDLLLLLQSVREAGFMLKHQLIWNKNNHVLGRCDYDYKHEPIVYGWKIGGTHKFYGGGQFKTSVWDIPKPMQSKLHPTMKPVELIENAVLDGSDKGQTVLDLFGGSGSTLIACEKTGRVCRMMELSPRYVDVIVRRWQEFTGQEATLEDGGKTFAQVKEERGG
jgi:DNA modification methylase